MLSHDFQYASGQEPIPENIGRFKVIKPPSVSKGSHATVYKGSDPISDQLVAIKVLRNEFESYTTSIMSSLVGEIDAGELKKEAHLLKVLQHPNIVSIFEMGDDIMYGPYIIMEWMAGGDLKSYLSRDSGTLLPRLSALSVANDILRAMETAHGMGIVHGDIKPSNILLDAQGISKLADFGIARNRRDSIKFPARGTQGYMPPEQTEMDSLQSLGPTADVYALGAVIYEMLTGRLPGRNEEVPSLLPHVEYSVAKAIIKSLASTPEERFASAAAMSEALA